MSSGLQKFLEILRGTNAQQNMPRIGQTVPGSNLPAWSTGGINPNASQQMPSVYGGMPQAPQQNKGLLDALMPALLNMGKYGGARAGGFMQMQQQQEINRMRQQQQYNDWLLNQQRMEQAAQDRKTEEQRYREQTGLEQFKIGRAEQVEKERSLAATEKEYSDKRNEAAREIRQWITNTNLDMSDEKSVEMALRGIVDTYDLKDEAKASLVRAGLSFAKGKKLKSDTVATKPALEKGLYKGKESFANYVNGRFFNPATNEDITAEFRPYRQERDADKPKDYTNELDRAFWKLNSDPVVRNFETLQSQYKSIANMVEGGYGGPGDMATLYMIMKSLDPTSVVRESEYASAARTGNIFAGAFARFNGMFDPQGGFLSDQVKKDFLKVSRNRMDVTREQYKLKRSEVGKLLKESTGGKYGDVDLPQHELPSIYGETGAETPITEMKLSVVEEIAKKHGVKVSDAVKELQKKGVKVVP